MPFENVDINDDGTINIDFTGLAEERLMPDGVYPARVEDAEIKLSSSSNNPTLYLNMELLGPEAYAGKRLRTTVTLQHQYRDMLQKALIALGYPREEVQGGIRLDPAMLLEKTCGAVVGHQTYEGEITNQINRLVPIARCNVGEMTPGVPFDATDPDKVSADDGLVF